MKLKNVSENQLLSALLEVADQYDANVIFNREPERKGNFLHFTLKVKDSSGPGARRSHSGRKLASACWHVHRDLMMLIFDRHPDAILVTALARYEGRDDFYNKFEATGNVNIGSQFQPITMQDACEC